MTVLWKPVSSLLGLLSCLRLSLLVSAAPNEQTPLSYSSWDHERANYDAWDLSRGPDENSTGRYIFDTTNSFLKLWPNTRLRNGHNLAAALIPTGTLLYHGTFANEVPRIPEWVAFDPEHSTVFCRHWDEEPHPEGCWHLTFVAARPLKVLYFDGSGAAKIWGGPLDSQDILAWGGIRPNRTYDEFSRIVDLCAWAKEHDIDGLLRMEMDFEVMFCDFSTGLDVVSSLNLHENHVTMPPQMNESVTFRLVETGKWHDQFPHEKRIHLDYTRIISFYDVSLFPDLQEHRLGQSRWDHRLKDITPTELVTLHRTLNETLQGQWGVSRSGIDWSALLTVVEQRFNERLNVLRYILFDMSTKSNRNLKDVLGQAHRLIRDMLNPYLLNSIYPTTPRGQTPKPGSTTDLNWAAPAFAECSTTHTRYLESPAVFSILTHSERVILRATQETVKEICRVLTGIWAEGVESGVGDMTADSVIQRDMPDTLLHELQEKWGNQIQGLMDWLDWSYWVTCKPACGFEEMCYLPTWPFFKHWPRGPKLPSRPPQIPGGNYSQYLAANFVADGDDGELLQPKPGPDDDWYHPSPRCIRRLEPFGFKQE